MSAPAVPPAPAPEVGHQVLDDMRAVLTRYVVLPSEAAADAVTLWIAATHALDAFQHAPRLAIKSPEKRCGKSRLLDVINGTCHRPLMSVNASVAAIFRSIGGEHPPTLLVDEADALWGTRKVAEQNEELRALLNAGHQKGRPALRCVGPQQTPTEFPTFAMAALAGIGDMPDTITDRAVNVTMRRRTATEVVSTFRARRDGPVLEEMRQRLAAWAGAHIHQLGEAEPEMPLEDRAADTWEPLVAIADAAGGAWPERARRAAQVMTAAAEVDDAERSPSTRLLEDVREVFTEMSGVSFLTSAVLLERLQKVDGAPWAEWGFTTVTLAARLRQFEIRPVRNSAGKARGYKREHLDDAFARYLRTVSDDGAQEPSEPDPAGGSSEPVRAVRLAPAQGRASDGSGASDGSTRQSRQTRQTVSPGARPFLTPLTGPDGGRAADGSDGPTIVTGSDHERG